MIREKVTKTCLNCKKQFQIHYRRKDTAKFCDQNCKHEYADSKILYNYPCCNKQKLLRPAEYDRAQNEKRQCRDCHLKNIRMLIPPMSNENKKSRSNRWKANNPSFKEINKQKISERMKLNNPTDDPYVIQKIRKKVIEQKRKMITKGGPNYNPKSIPIIERYGKQNGYNFQHAENGGEYYIRELGYWVDGYDPNKNVVIEYDEKHHFVGDKIRDKDVRRQKEIMEYLKCKFIRIDYNNNVGVFENGSQHSNSK